MGVRGCLREVSAYRGLNCRVLVEKLLGQQFGVCLREVSVSRGSTVQRKILIP